MRLRHYLGFAAASLLLASAAQAQSGPAPAANLQGPVVKGVCYLSPPTVFATAQVGQMANGRLQQFSNAIQNQLNGERNQLNNDIRAYQQRTAGQSEAVRQAQAAPLNQRSQALEVERQRYAQQLELTRVQVTNQIGAAIQPILAEVYSSKKCGLLLDRGSVLGGNSENDLTPALIQAVNAKITSINFNLAQLPANNGTAGGR